MRISVLNEGEAGIRASARGRDQAVLVYEGQYEPGDVIEYGELEPDRFYAVRADAAIEESLVLVKAESFRFRIPFAEKKTSYNPLSFAGERHYLSIRRAEEYETGGMRNLALNPLDQHENGDVYPHAHANVETRGEAVFAARNAIDGVLACAGHGEWPYESWGINRQADAELTLEFGRPVDIAQIRLYTRADFPHDSWWVRGTVRFSDGSAMELAMDKKEGEPHCFAVEPVRKNILWLRLGELIRADDPSPFPALTQIEVYGTESR